MNTIARVAASKSLQTVRSVLSRSATSHAGACEEPTPTLPRAVLSKNERHIKELQAAYERLARQRRHEENQYRHEYEQRMRQVLRDQMYKKNK